MRWLLIVFLFLPQLSMAVSMFGIELKNAKQNELRRTIRNNGGEVVKEAGRLEFYDEYKSQNLLEGSNRIYLGFLPEDKTFAFAEYEFIGIQQNWMLAKMKKKYGNPITIEGKFISDKIHVWQSEGIEIRFYIDWAAYKTRITYAVPEKLALLKEEKQRIDAAILRGELSKQDHAF